MKGENPQLLTMILKVSTDLNLTVPRFLSLLHNYSFSYTVLFISKRFVEEWKKLISPFLPLRSTIINQLVIGLLNFIFLQQVLLTDVVVCWEFRQLPRTCYYISRQYKIKNL